MHMGLFVDMTIFTTHPVRFHLAYIDLYQPKHIPNTGSVLDILGDAMGVLLSPVMLLASHASRRVVGG
jgi:hypothetical protein